MLPGEPCSVSEGDNAPDECEEAPEDNDEEDEEEDEDDEEELVESLAKDIFASVVRPQLGSTSSAKLLICVVMLCLRELFWLSLLLFAWFMLLLLLWFMLPRLPVFELIWL